MHACSLLIWTQRLWLLRSDTKVRANSIVSTADFSANRRCGILRAFAQRVRLNWNPLVLPKVPCDARSGSNCTTGKLQLGILILPISCLFLPIPGAFVSDGTSGVSNLIAPE